MKNLHWTMIVLTGVVLMAFLGGCSPLHPQLSAASVNAAPARGGAGSVIVNGQPHDGVVVVGTGRASAEPEVAEIGFGVELRGHDPDALVSEAAQKMEAAIAAAREFGILEDRTRTLDYNLWVETIHDPDTGRPTDEIVYHLSHQMQVTTDNLDNVGELLASLVNAGANAISDVNFTIDTPEVLVEEAREAALADAQARATHITDQLGISLGNPVLVTETGGNFPIFADRGIGGGAMIEQAAPSVTPGSFSVDVSIQIVYEIR